MTRATAESSHGSQRPLRIGIATPGRFHVLDLARELDALGHHVRFYSYVPRSRARKFGLPDRCHVSLLPYLAPVIALERLCRGTRFAPFTELLLNRAVDNAVALRLERCDVFIGMSGTCVKSLARARRKFGAKIVLERGSVHIEAQREILEEVRRLNPQAAGVPVRNVLRETRGYSIADRIAVPSHHVEMSFLARGFLPETLFRNPYGVDLAMFKPAPEVQRDPRLLLFVGTWSYRKGVDVLTKTMQKLAPDGFRLCHVGPPGDAPLPSAKWFRSVGKVDQTELPEWYCRARCLVLPSREEGLSLVQIQANACGCPVIGSNMSGAVDLQEQLPGADMVSVVLVDDEEGLAKAIIKCAPVESFDPSVMERFREAFSWQRYAQRCEGMLLDLVDRPSSDS